MWHASAKLRLATARWRVLLAGDGMAMWNVDISICFMHVLEACVRQWIQVVNDSSCRLATA